mgnify:CR=1 FL=1
MADFTTTLFTLSTNNMTQESSSINSGVVSYPVLGSTDFIVVGELRKAYDMRGTDVDCGIGNATYRYWTVYDAPDPTGSLYVGTKCGGSPLTNICIIKKYKVVV